ncbi:MAG TPA: DnaJ domain-containing protein [Nitrospirales bacterium]
MKDYYHVLGIEKDATLQEIKTAFRRLAKENHPDHHPGDKKAEARFKEVSEAYGVVGDAAAKGDYDRLRFGGHGTYGVKEQPINPEIFVSQMLEKLYEAGHSDIQGYLLNNIAKLREEIEVVRRLTKEKIGYDAFKPQIVMDHAAEAFAGWIDEEMEVRRSKIIHVALFNLLKQRAADPKRESDVDRLKKRLENAWDDGQKAGYRDALELFYQRNG